MCVRLKWLVFFTMLPYIRFWVDVLQETHVYRFRQSSYFSACFEPLHEIQIFHVFRSSQVLRLFILAWNIIVLKFMRSVFHATLNIYPCLYKCWTTAVGGRITSRVIVITNRGWHKFTGWWMYGERWIGGRWWMDGEWLFKK